MEHIKIATEKIIRGWQQQRHRVDKETDIIGKLKTLLTKQEQKHIRYYSCRDTRITLRVDSSVWLYTLSLKKEQILNNLNRLCESNHTIKTILLQLDRSRNSKKSL